MEGITLTFGDMAENHKGMEQIGHRVSEGQGFQLADFNQIIENIESLNIEWEIYGLNTKSEHPEAYVLVLKDGVNKLMGNPEASRLLLDEQKGLQYDKKAFMYGRVVNKSARWNLCFDQESRDPDYENGKGRIIGFTEVPLMNYLRNYFEQYFGPKAQNLKVESNYYYDITKCGIGYHGDTERRKVIGVRLGNVGYPMYYQWYKNGNPEGDRIQVDLNPGDIYIMSEKAVGTDWKRKTVYTLRHATGADKFTRVG